MGEIKAQYETNVFGVIRMTQAVIPFMRKQKPSDIIINISSAVGRYGVPGESIYASTKFAVEGLSESMTYGIRMV
jgi:NADP-dependent 3-hydroxy acid dehydrogenase YdfG